MKRALAGLAAVAALGSGCASIPATDEVACDFLYDNRYAARDDDAEARARIIAEFGEEAGVAPLSGDLRSYVEIVVRDARREERGRDVRYFSARLDDALSVCMDLGW
ncbi:hypothetical protein [Trujillonella endophytica]|uniref:Lipoprotein n=1 Tax=Trujillonella endophytica TaxID=673521 RepID=A0A1H8PCT5_9ACTN|nr:hypothetical protein [Trujillella endophytica]SEO39752.1 hypothetical protein SAMN05660991_00106 [Trujillella endophytica]